MGLLTLSSLERITCTRLTQECQLDLAPRLSLSLSLSKPQASSLPSVSQKGEETTR